MKILRIISSYILALLMMMLLYLIKNPITVTKVVTSSNNYIITISPNVVEKQEIAVDNIKEIKRVESEIYDIPPYPGMKKWMSHKLFGKSTKQYKLQQYAITDSSGLRGVDGLYCIAIGSRFGTKIGQRIDLVLENGTVIPCVMGDQKANVHTDASNTFSNSNGNPCCSEFIVDTAMLNRDAAKRGDTSFIYDIWNSPVDKIIVYDINILEELEAETYGAINYYTPYA